MKIPRLFQEFVYALLTRDKYAEFDSSKSFNRLYTSAESEHLYSHHSAQNGVSSDSRDSHEGVHEVRLAWRHIKRWLGAHSPDLNASLASPCTDSDLADFQKDVGCVLPACVAEFFRLTDGQLGLNLNTSGGLVFGLKLMSLDEVAVMTEHWRRVSQTLNAEMSARKQSSSLLELLRLQESHNSTSVRKLVESDVSLFERELGTGSRSLSASSAASVSTTSSASLVLSSSSFLYPSMPQQRAIPPGSIHSTFAHPMWIPLITDEVGNCLGIDLAPPTDGCGKWGQVILFGREFDTKFLIADNFGDFLLIFANDLERGNWEIKNDHLGADDDDDLLVGSEGELVFVDKEDGGDEVAYLEVLTRRSIKKWITSITDKNSENAELIQDLKRKPMDYSSIKLNAIDRFINENLSNIDELNLPVNSNMRAPLQPLNSTNSARSSRLKGRPLADIAEVENDDTVIIEGQENCLKNIPL